MKNEKRWPRKRVKFQQCFYRVNKLEMDIDYLIIERNEPNFPWTNFDGNVCVARTLSNKLIGTN